MFCLPLYSVACSTLIDFLFPSLLGRAREGLLLLVFEVEHWIAVDNLAG